MSSENKIVVYKAKATPSSGSKVITKMVVDRVTDSSYWLHGTRYARKCDYAEVFLQLPDAKAFIARTSQVGIERAETQIQKWTEHLEKASKITDSEIEVVDSPY